MTTHTITVPDIGSDEAAEVVEVCIAVGDQLELEQSLIVLETDKASVEVPSSHAGKVTALLVKEGDQIKTGAPIAEVELAGANDDESQQDDTDESEKKADKESTGKVESNKVTEDSAKQDATRKDSTTKDKTTQEQPKKEKNQKEDAKASSKQEIKIPDLGGAGEVDVIEICVTVGDEITEGDSLIVLETDKASLDIPSPYSGKIIEISIAEGTKVKEGQVIAVIASSHSSVQDASLQHESAHESEAETDVETKSKKERGEEKTSASTKSHAKTTDASNEKARHTPANDVSPVAKASGGDVYAGPAVRKLARQLGVDLTKVKSSGPKNRSTKEDVRKYVRDLIANKSSGSGIPAVPAVDFSKFGTVERVKLSKIHRVTATNMHRSWLNVPHVTQFDDADISDLETYRKAQKDEAEKRGVKLSPVPFLLKACAMTLRAEPSFNVSLDPDGEHLFKKDYVHIGMAVDTPAGLVVPVLRDVDKKSVWDIAKEINEYATKARDGKLLPKDMQGGCFTISSLGAIGGQGFTPIVNTPEVGILGVSKANTKPWWNGKEFEPRTFLPVSLSYDHRAVNGADAGRFLTHLVGLLKAVDELMTETP